jgi:hypothetical protein
VDPFLPKDTAGIVNSDYGVQCAEGIATSGSPVTVNLRWYELFLPLVLRP